MYRKIKSALMFSSLAILLVGCADDQSLDSVNKIDQQPHDTEDLDENDITTTGYIQEIDSEEIWVTAEKNATTKNTGVIVDITGIEDLSKLAVGQKVHIINYDRKIHPSNPAREKADAIEIVE